MYVKYPAMLVASGLVVKSAVTAFSAEAVTVIVRVAVSESVSSSLYAMSSVVNEPTVL